METVLLIVVVVMILAYYGFMQSAETVAGIANREVSYLDRQHKVAVIDRTLELESRVTDETVVKMAELSARLDAIKI